MSSESEESTENYSRLNLILVKGGTLLTKKFLKKRAKELCPQGNIDAFLKAKKSVICKRIGKQYEKIVFPENGRTNLKDWDLYLLCSVLLTACSLQPINQLDIDKILKMRSKLFHLHEPIIPRRKYQKKIGKLKLIFKRTCTLISDSSLEEEMERIVERYENQFISKMDVIQINHLSNKMEVRLKDIMENPADTISRIMDQLNIMSARFPPDTRVHTDPDKGESPTAPESFDGTYDKFIDGKQQKDAAKQRILDENTKYLNIPEKQISPELFDKTNGKRCTEDPKQQDVGIDPRDSDSDVKCIHGINPDNIADLNDLKGDWHKCLALGNKKYAHRALRKHLLPDQRLLNELTKHFGRKSKIMSEICKRICLHIAAQEGSIYDVWPAVKVNCDDIVFVIIVKSSLKDRTQQFGKTINYSYVKRSLGDVSCEGKDVINSLEFKQGSTRLSPADYVVLQQSINGNNVELMKRHKRLMMISISSVRSEGHESSFHKVTFEPCLVLYVLIKGYIPINEDPFETHYSGVSVDVREGIFNLFTGPAGNYHANLKSGCQIVDRNIGTLGGFVDYPGWGTCGLTCAHVVLNPTEMKSLAPKLDNDMDLEVVLTGQTVYQPDSSKDSHAVGKVIKAIYREGGGGESGIDIAVFHILQRYPVLGDFPDMKDGSHSTISYDSGKTADITRLGFSDVYKFGAKTDLTTGSVVMEKKGDTMSVRTYEKYIVSNEYDVKLHNLIEIESKPDMSSFAEQGDSGALVFCEGRNKELICVGVVEGGTSHNTCVVMPILPILEQLILVSLKSFEINRMEQKMAQRGHSLTEMWNQNMSSAYNALESRITESERTTDARIGRSEQAIETRMTQIEQNLQNLVQQESTKTVSEVRNLLQNFMLQISKSSQPNN